MNGIRPQPAMKLLIFVRRATLKQLFGWIVGNGDTEVKKLSSKYGLPVTRPLSLHKVTVVQMEN
jgi:metallophosphoesterase superfamily enzyme